MIIQIVCMYVYLFIHNPIKKPLNHHEITMNPIFHGSLKAPLDPCWGARRQLCLCRALQLSQPQSWNSTCSWAVRHALAHWVQQAISHLSSLRLGLQEDIGPWWQWALLLTLNTYRVSLTCVCPGCTRRAWRFLLLILLFLWRAQYFLHTQRVQRTACANACCLLLKEWWVLLLRA